MKAYIYTSIDIDGVRVEKQSNWTTGKFQEKWGVLMKTLTKEEKVNDDFGVQGTQTQQK